MRYHFFFLLISLLYVDSVSAYVGPGLGVGVIGAIVGVIVTILLAMLGIVWYPLKRLFRKNDAVEAADKESDGS